MIFFFNAHGELIKSTPERVFQGSNKANTIDFICPTSQNDASIVSIAFTLPNGEITPPEPLESKVMLDGVYDEKGANFYLWSFEIPSSITAYAGLVTCQFSIAQANGVVVKTASATFYVEEGVELVEPEQGDSYNTVISNLIALNQNYKNKVDKSYVDEINEEQDEKITNLEDETAKKVNRIKNTSGGFEAYTESAEGNIVGIPIKSTPDSLSIAVRDYKGSVKTANPIDPTDAVNLEHFDNNVPKIELSLKENGAYSLDITVPITE